MKDKFKKLNKKGLMIAGAVLTVIIFGAMIASMPDERSRIRERVEQSSVKSVCGRTSKAPIEGFSSINSGYTNEGFWCILKHDTEGRLYLCRNHLTLLWTLEARSLSSCQSSIR